MYTNFTFSATDTGTTFGNIQPITELMAVPHFAEKLKGRYIMKCNMRVILQINASKFQAGRYILAWVPSGGLKSSTDVATAWLKMHRHSLTQVTQLPHVELDINKDSQAELVIPYINYQLGAYAQNTTSYGDVGWVFAYPYSPVASAAGSTTVYGSLYMKFEDVELGGLALPQMSWRGPKKLAASSSEQEAAGLGPISSVLRNVSVTSEHLAKIPLLSSFMQPTKWVTDILGDVASVWGWSRPLTLAPVQRVLSQPLSFGASCDVADTCQPLSLCSNNAVGMVRGIGGTDYDEMSIDYLKAIPTFCGTSSWSSASASGTSVVTINTSPKVMNTTTDGVNTLKNYSPMGLIATHFQLWRGSLTYIFKIVKTDFHSGRLSVTYNPTSVKRDANPAATIQSGTYIHREIWDIRDNTEFRITVPYISDTPWRRTDEAGGSLIIKVLDPLIAPSTVSSSVGILIECCGGPDLEFAVPIKGVIEYPVAPFSQQMSWEGPSNNGIVSSIVGNASIGDNGLLESSACIGEKIQSIRSLLKRYASWAVLTPDATSIIINPYMIDVSNVKDAVSAIAKPTALPDLVNVFAPCYALSRGGMRIRYLGEASAAGRSFVNSTLNWYISAGKIYSGVVDAGASFGVNFQYGTGNPITFHDLEKSSGVELSFPQYSPGVARPNGAHICNLTDTLGPTPNDREVSSVSSNISSVTTFINRYVFRSVADDYSLHCFVSVPPMAA